MSRTYPLLELQALFRTSPAFRRVFLADVASQIGEGGLLIVFPILILEATHDVTLTGLAFSGEILAFGLVSPLAGYLADRLEQKWLLLGANFVRVALLGLLLWALSVGASVLACLGLSLSLGAAGAFFMPARAAFLRRLLAGEALQQAIALEGTMVFLLRLVSPALMGLLLVVFPATVGIQLDMLTYMVSALLLAPAWVTGPRLEAPDEEPAGAWKEGWRVIGASDSLRGLLLLDVALCLVGMAAFSITVALLEQELHLPAQANGWLLATTGLAGAVGAQLAARLPQHRAVYAGLTGAIALTYLSVPMASTLGALMAMWVVRGLAIGALCVLLNQRIAREVPGQVMGRVQAAWGLGACLACFLGSFSTPWLLRALGATHSYTLFGTLLALVAIGLGLAAVVNVRTSPLSQPAEAGGL